jgi:hypothetical protein
MSRAPGAGKPAYGSAAEEREREAEAARLGSTTDTRRRTMKKVLDELGGVARTALEVAQSAHRDRLGADDGEYHPTCLVKFARDFTEGVVGKGWFLLQLNEPGNHMAESYWYPSMDGWSFDLYRVLVCEG